MSNCETPTKTLFGIKLVILKRWLDIIALSFCSSFILLILLSILNEQINIQLAKLTENQLIPISFSAAILLGFWGAKHGFSLLAPHAWLFGKYPTSLVACVIPFTLVILWFGAKRSDYIDQTLSLIVLLEVLALGNITPILMKLLSPDKASTRTTLQIKTSLAFLLLLLFVAIVFLVYLYIWNINNAYLWFTGSILYILPLFLVTKYPPLETSQQSPDVSQEIPIYDALDDRLEYKKYAEHLYQRIVESKNKALSFALIGHYGSGKSSCLNLLEKEFRDNKRNDYIIGRISTWGASENAYVSIILKNIVKELSKHADCLSLLNLPNSYVDALQEISSPWMRILSIFDTKSSAEESLTKIDTILECINKKMLVFIEDIDRNSEEINAELAGLLDRLHHLKNLSFIIAVVPEHDKQGILTRVTDYPLQLFYGHKILPLFDKLLKPIIDDPSLTENQKLYMVEGNLFKTYLEEICRIDDKITPRILKQAINKTQAMWEVLKGEIYFYDLLALNIIYCAYPSTWHFIRNNNRKYEFNLGEDYIKSNIPKDNTFSLSESILLTWLYPSFFKTQSISTHFINLESSEKIKIPRISEQKYLTRYINLMIDTNEIKDQEKLEYLDKMGTDDNRINNAIISFNPGFIKGVYSYKTLDEYKLCNFIRINTNPRDRESITKLFTRLALIQNFSLFNQAANELGLDEHSYFEILYRHFRTESQISYPYPSEDTYASFPKCRDYLMAYNILASIIIPLFSNFTQCQEILFFEWWISQDEKFLALAKQLQDPLTLETLEEMKKKNQQIIEQYAAQHTVREPNAS